MTPVNPWVHVHLKTSKICNFFQRKLQMSLNSYVNPLGDDEQIPWLQGCDKHGSILIVQVGPVKSPCVQMHWNVLQEERHLYIWLWIFFMRKTYVGLSVTQTPWFWHGDEVQGSFCTVHCEPEKFAVQRQEYVNKPVWEHVAPLKHGFEKHGFVT